MKIAIVNKHRQETLGGSEIQCDLIAAGLTARGHEVLYVAPESKGITFDTPYRVAGCGCNHREITENVVKFAPDIIYWRFNKRCFYPSVQQFKQQQIPVIFAASSVTDLQPWSYPSEQSVRKGIRKSIINRWHHSGLRYVDALTVNNRDYLGKVSMPIQRYIPNGMETASVPFQWDNPFCVWIGSIKKVKRPEIMIRLAGQFEDSGFDFLMVGEIQQDKYAWLREPANTPSNLHYLGPRSLEEVNGILAASELHVFTSIDEGFPNVFIQAWLQKKLSVSFGIDPSGYIRSEGLGYQTEENWDQFVEKVSEYLHHPEKRSRTESRAYRFATKTFAIENTVDEVEKLINEVVMNKR